MGAAQDAVAKEAVTLVGDRTVITEETEVCEGVMVKTPPSPPPHQDGQRMWGGSQNWWYGGRLA